MTEKQDDIALLHIYAQYGWHDTAWIAGNRDGLLKLRNAIDAALTDKHGLGLSESVSVNDGEGYKIAVVENDKPWADPSWRRLCVPYISRMANETRNSDEAIMPSDLVDSIYLHKLLEN